MVRTTPPISQYSDREAGTVKPIHSIISGMVYIMTLPVWAAWEFWAVSLSWMPSLLVTTESFIFWLIHMVTTWLPADSSASRNRPTLGQVQKVEANTLKGGIRPRLQPRKPKLTPFSTVSLMVGMASFSTSAYWGISWAAVI